MLRLKKKEKIITYKIREFFLNKEKINNVYCHWSLKKNKLFNKGLENFDNKMFEIIQTKKMKFKNQNF